MYRKNTRREFVRIAATATAVVALTGQEVLPATKAESGIKWPIGCFNRPWSVWTYDQAISGIKEAGYVLTGILGDHADELFTAPQAKEQYLKQLRERIAKVGLEVNVAWLRTRHDVPLKDATIAARKQVDHASILGVKYLLTTGVDQRDMYEHFYQVMADVSAYAADRKMQIVLEAIRKGKA